MYQDFCTGRADNGYTMNELLTMKELPADNRPYEKCFAIGAESLSDAELLAVILRTGSRGVPAIQLAHKILGYSKVEQNLLGLHYLSISELMKINGVGKVKAIQIKCIVELSRRIAKTSAKSSLSFTKPETIADYYMEDVRHFEQEQMLLLMLNTKSRLLGDKVISKGTVNGSMITPREIFLEALNNHAVYIILVHNHPSGDPKPSREDILLTRRIRDAGSMIGIELLDHLIIGDKNYISFKERGIL